MNIKNIVLGIDLGTTNSVASYWDGNKAIFIKNNNSLIFPSNIEFTKKGKLICQNHNSNQIRNIKRLIGRNTNDLELLKLLTDINYPTKIKNNQVFLFNQFEKKKYSLEELNSLILNKIISNAEIQLNRKIKDVVISIPSHFNQYQRESVLISSRLSKLNCIRIINEPTAAALAYGLNIHNDINILVFDLGGGTFDLSVLNIDNGMFDVLGTYGNNNLGGEDFTKSIIQYIFNEFKNINPTIDINDSILKNNKDILRKEVERIKIHFSNDTMDIPLKIDNFYNDKENNISLDLYILLKFKIISNLYKKLLEQIKEYIDSVLIISNLEKEDIDYIVLVGGATKMRCIKFLIESYFNKEPICNINPDLVVSIGAGIQGYIINNPDDTFCQDITLIDAVPLSIGIDSDNGIMTKIIPKGTKIPVKKYKLFTTEENEQNDVDIKIYQGERELVENNYLIGSLNLNNLSKIEQGKSIIKVEILINVNGIINIKAYEKGKGNSNEISIDSNNNLFSEEKIRELINESDKYHQVDLTKKKIIKIYKKIREQLDNLIYNNKYNQYINLDDNDEKKLDIYINKISIDFGNILKPAQFLIDKTNYHDIELSELIIIHNKLRKILELNEKTYPSFVLKYQNNGYDKSTSSNFGSFEKNKDNYNSIFLNVLSTNINKINKDLKLSNYSKKLLLNYCNNLNFKLKSLSLDENLIEDYLNNFKKYIDLIYSNDKKLIENYGLFDNLNEIVIENNININLDNFDKTNKLNIFNLIYELCIKYNIEFDN